MKEETNERKWLWRVQYWESLSLKILAHEFDTFIRQRLAPCRGAQRSWPFALWLILPITEGLLPHLAAWCNPLFHWESTLGLSAPPSAPPVYSQGKKKCMEMNYGNFDGKLGKLHGAGVSFSQALSWSGVCRAARDRVGNIALCSRSIERPPLCTVHGDLQWRFICRVAWACLIYMLIQVYLSVPARAQRQKLACYPALGPSPHTSLTNL